nr:MAG TPA_asm: hypothetical protein [Caudoviricetes sp.]
MVVVPYDYHICAHIRRFRPSVIGGSFYFPCRMI